MLTPAYKLTFSRPSGQAAGALSNLPQAATGSNGRVIDTTDEPRASTVVELVVSMDMDAPADSFTLVMGQVGAFRPAREDNVTIALGYVDRDLEQVMTGEISSAESGLTIRRLTGHSAAGKLLRLFVGNHYEGQTAGAIVRDLAKQAGVEVAAAQDGIRFPAYVVEPRRSAYHHMHELASLCGFSLYITQEGELVFEKFTGGKIVHVFTYASHILDLEVETLPQRASLVEAWGESPGGGGAQEAWAWLTKDFSASKGSAGSGQSRLLLERPALRTAEAARQAAEASLDALQRRALRGRLLLTGQPQVRLGDAIRIKEVPEEGFNDVYQVRSVTHRITKSGGFTTSVEFWASAP